jgi:hypothetical protein
MTEKANGLIDELLSYISDGYVDVYRQSDEMKRLVSYIEELEKDAAALVRRNEMGCVYCGRNSMYDR